MGFEGPDLRMSKLALSLSIDTKGLKHLSANAFLGCTSQL